MYLILPFLTHLPNLQINIISYLRRDKTLRRIIWLKLWTILEDSFPDTYLGIDSRKFFYVGRSNIADQKPDSNQPRGCCSPSGSHGNRWYVPTALAHPCDRLAPCPLLLVIQEGSRFQHWGGKEGRSITTDRTLRSSVSLSLSLNLDSIIPKIVT